MLVAAGPARGFGNVEYFHNKFEDLSYDNERKVRRFLRDFASSDGLCVVQQPAARKA